jgi:hypothetical protein
MLDISGVVYLLYLIPDLKGVKAARRPKTATIPTLVSGRRVVDKAPRNVANAPPGCVLRLARTYIPNASELQTKQLPEQAVRCKGGRLVYRWTPQGIGGGTGDGKTGIAANRLEGGLATGTAVGANGDWFVANQASI